ncbi:MAG: hypothetical protein KAH77_10155, partial [Thiomargarita sp.]|nr:hypothetical protein [Thiomargarita sp.]
RRQFNPYPMLRMSAHDKETGELLAATDVVLPVSSQIGCSNCHATGESAAKDVSISWANDTDINIQSKKNILILHDHEEGTDLYNQTPVLCADCHYSAAIDFTGAGPQGLQQHLPLFSQVMHKFHGELRNTEGEPIFPSTLEVSASQSCYQCHPSQTSACQRGAMRTAGLECSSCHGDLLAVGGKFPLLEGGSIDGNNDGQARRPWRDLPRCQSCHTGDVINYLTGDDLEFFEDGLRLIQTYKTGDNSASSILAENQRFAENEHTLYRNSKGHHGVACEACHGSTHAIWSNADTTANDNLTALQLQGHAGTIIECDTCHATDSLPLTLEGPHGLHNVNDMRWTNGHASFYNNDNQACQACHGLNLEGTALSKMAVTRNISGVELKKGQKVSCDLCHGQP